MRGGMFAIGLILFLLGGFWTFEFYTLYQDVTTLGGILTLAFSSSQPLALSFLNDIGFNLAASQSYSQAVNIVEIFLALFAVIALIGFILLIVGAATTKKTMK